MSWRLHKTVRQDGKPVEAVDSSAKHDRFLLDGGTATRASRAVRSRRLDISLADLQHGINGENLELYRPLTTTASIQPLRPITFELGQLSRRLGIMKFSMINFQAGYKLDKVQILGS